MMAASNSMRGADAFDTRTWKQDAWAVSIQGWVETKHPGAFWWPFWRVTITRDYITSSAAAASIK